MARGERGFIYGRWYVAYRGLGVTLSWKDREWGWSEEWYDGPMYILGLGPVIFSYVP